MIKGGVEGSVYLRELYIEGYNGFRNLFSTFLLKGLNVIVGKNASSKTAIPDPSKAELDKLTQVGFHVLTALEVALQVQERNVSCRRFQFFAGNGLIFDKYGCYNV